MIKFVPFILYLWGIGLYQVILGEAISIYGITVNLPVLMVLLVGLFKSEVNSCWFGFAVGLVAFAGLTATMGWHALIMAAVGYLAFHIRAKINMDSLYSKLLLVFAGVAIHNIVVLVMSKSDSIFFLMATQALTGAVYTTVIAWIYFLLKEDTITFKRFKAIF